MVKIDDYLKEKNLKKKKIKQVVFWKVCSLDLQF